MYKFMARLIRHRWLQLLARGTRKGAGAGRTMQLRRALGLAVGLLLALPLLAMGDAGSFAPHPTTPAFGAGDSYAVALGDLDGDGDLDAVVANHSDAETVWLNDGFGSFAPHPTTPSFVAGFIVDVALGDLDGDGDLDAVAANYSDDAETVWLNDGSGNLAPHPTTPSFGAGYSSDVALGDLDGDGDLDAVFANSNEQGQMVWLNDGSGSFTAHPTTPNFGTGYSSSMAVALGDLDGDGDLDAVVANYVQEETVWLNDGSGSFTAHPTTPTFVAGDSTNVALGDLDGDGDLDAVVANNNEQGETVWLNDGTGVFTPHPTTPTFGAGESFDVALGDLDGDGDLDVMVANGYAEAKTVWLNDGTGSFTPHPTTPAFGALGSSGIALGDLDGDADLDVIVANGGANREGETVWLNDGTAAPPTSIALGALSASPAVAPTWGLIALACIALVSVLYRRRR